MISSFQLTRSTELCLTHRIDTEEFDPECEAIWFRIRICSVFFRAFRGQKS